MTGVVTGFSIILVIIGIGWLVARAGVVTGDGRFVLNRVAFFVATPALLFTVLAKTDVRELISPVMGVTTLAALAVAAIYVVLSRLRFPGDAVTTTLGAASSGYVNSNNIGLPVAVYILGDASHVAPVLILQLVVLSPAIIAVLEAGRGSAGGALRGARRALANPIILASALGTVVSVTGVSTPAPIAQPLEMLGAAAIPMVLLSFGMSLSGQRILLPGTGRRQVLIATALKVLVMPLIAWALGRFVFGLGPGELFAAVVIAALPTAQNIYNYAATYRRAEVIVRDTVFLSTLGSIPAIAAISLLLAH